MDIPDRDSEIMKRAVAAAMTTNKAIPSKQNSSHWFFENMGGGGQLNPQTTEGTTIDRYSRLHLQKTAANYFVKEGASEDGSNNVSNFKQPPGMSGDSFASRLEDVSQSLRTRTNDILKPISSSTGSTLGTNVLMTKDAAGSLQAMSHSLCALTDSVNPAFTQKLDSTLKKYKVDSLSHMPGKLMGSIQNLANSASKLLSVPLEFMSDMYRGAMKMFKSVAKMANNIFAMITKFFIGPGGLMDGLMGSGLVKGFLGIIKNIGGKALDLVKSFGGTQLIGSLTSQLGSVSSLASKFLSNPTILAQAYMPSTSLFGGGLGGILGGLSGGGGLGGLLGGGGGLGGMLGKLGGGSLGGIAGALGGSGGIGGMLGNLGGGNLTGILGSLGGGGNLSNIVGALSKGGNLGNIVGSLGGGGGLGNVIGSLAQGGNLGSVIGGALGGQGGGISNVLGALAGKGGNLGSVVGALGGGGGLGSVLGSLGGGGSIGTVLGNLGGGNGLSGAIGGLAGTLGGGSIGGGISNAIGATISGFGGGKAFGGGGLTGAISGLTGSVGSFLGSGGGSNLTSSLGGGLGGGISNAIGATISGFGGGKAFGGGGLTGAISGLTGSLGNLGRGAGIGGSISSLLGAVGGTGGGLSGGLGKLLGGMGGGFGGIASSIGSLSGAGGIGAKITSLAGNLFPTKNPANILSSLIPSKLGGQIAQTANAVGLGFQGNLGFSVGNSMEKAKSLTGQLAFSKLGEQAGILGPLLGLGTSKPDLTNKATTGPLEAVSSGINSGLIASREFVQEIDTSTRRIFEQNSINSNNRVPQKFLAV
jgi:hypothetical protein